jgi:hypothetical protein
LRLPEGFRAGGVELLRAEVRIPHESAEGQVSFEVPGVVDYEVAAIHRL